MTGNGKRRTFKNGDDRGIVYPGFTHINSSISGLIGMKIEYEGDTEWDENGCCLIIFSLVAWSLYVFSIIYWEHFRG